jgi:DNA repair exonuclease SbcCD ATPase subunit
MDDNTLRPTSRTTNASPGNNLKDIDLSSSAWNALEEEFQEVISELHELPQLEKFKLEYERLHKILQSSHKNELELRKRCEELNQDIITTVSKVQQSLSTLKEDQQLVAQLKREIEKTWKLVDQSREKEQKDTDNLNKLVSKEKMLAQEIKDGLPTHKTTAIEELESNRDKHSKDRDTSNSELIVLINEVNALETKIKKFNLEKRNMMARIQSMTDEMATLGADYSEQMKNIEQSEQKLKLIKIKLETKNSEILAKEALIEKGNQKISDLEQELKEQSLITQKAEKECEGAEHKREKLDRDLKDQIKQNSKQYAENEELKENLRGREIQIKSMKDLQVSTQKAISAVS